MIKVFSPTFENMASKQSKDKGARLKTSLKSNSQHQQDENHESSELENPRGQDKKVRQGTDLTEDSIASSVDQYELPYVRKPDFREPDLVDVVVIYSKEDFEEVDTEFIPWLKKMASQYKDAQIYLYDDPDFSRKDNMFRKTEEVLAKCMKILVYVTDNFMKDKTTKGIVEELICLTRFMDETETQMHISKISQLANNMNRNLSHLYECVLRQRENAIMPVQTTAERIRFTGLSAIFDPVQYFDLEKNAKFKQRVAKNVIKAAVCDRKQQESLMANHRNRSPRYFENQYPTPGRHSYLFTADSQNNTSHRNPGDLLDVSMANTQLISKSTIPIPLKSQLKNKEVSADKTIDTSTGFMVTSTSSSQSLLLKPSQVNESQTMTDVRVAANPDRNPASSTTVDGNITQDISQEDNESRSTAMSGLNSSEKRSGSILTSSSHTSETSDNTEIKAHGAEAALPPEDGQNCNDLEIDQLESSRNKCENNKTKTSKLTESGYGSINGQEELSPTDESNKSEKDSGETSLENMGLVNDSGDAALGKEILDCQNTESMPSTDAEKVNSETPLGTMLKPSMDNDSKVMEHTVRYSGKAEHSSRGVMASNPALKNFDGRHPVYPPDPSNVYDEKPCGSSQDLYHLLTGIDSNKMPVLTVVHHHHYEKPERQQPLPQTKKEPTINVYGANSVVIGKHSHAIVADSTMISNRSDQPEMDTPTPQEAKENDMMADSGTNSTSSSPTTGSYNDLSSPKLSEYNFTKEWKTGHHSDQWKKSTQQTEERKITDNGSSSDEDNSLKDISSVSMGTDTGDGPENCFDIKKETNLKDTEEVNQKDRYTQITNESGLPSSIESQAWQSEAESILGPSLSSDLESLVDMRVQSHQRDSMNSEDFTPRNLAVYSESTVQSGRTTLPNEYRGVEQHCGDGGHWEIISQQKTSLFTPTCVNKSLGFLRTNALGMMAPFTMLYREKQELDNQDDDVD